MNERGGCANREMSQKDAISSVCVSHTESSRFTRPHNPTRPLLYLVGGCIQVGQGDVQQVVLQRVDPRGDRQLQRFYGFVGNFLTQDAVQSSHAVTWGEEKDLFRPQSAGQTLRQITGSRFYRWNCKPDFSSGHYHSCDLKKGTPWNNVLHLFF